MDYEDNELTELKQKIVLSITIFLIIAIPFIMFLSNRLIEKESKIIKMLDKNESMFILACDDNNKQCKEIDNYLKEKNI